MGQRIVEKFGVGNIVTIVSMIAVAAINYGRFSADLGHLKDDLAEVKGRITTIERSLISGFENARNRGH